MPVNQYLIHLVLAVTTVWLAGSKAGVVCIGADGHIAVEPAFHNHCGCGGDGESTPNPDGSSITHPCSPCTDIPIPGAPAGLDKIQKTTVTDADIQPSARLLTDLPQTATEGLCGFHYSYFSPLKDIILLT